MKKGLIIFALIISTTQFAAAEEIEMADTVSIQVMDQNSKQIIQENLDYTQADQSLPAMTAKTYTYSDEGGYRAPASLN